jgi:ribose transport system ATP-binding protein
LSLARQRQRSRRRYRDCVRCAGPEQTAGELSGGNQQKVALARLLHQNADVLLLDEPTRGVDVGSKAEIYRLIGELAAEGRAVLMASSYLPELLGICDRIAVLSEGKLLAVRSAGSGARRKSLTLLTRHEGEARCHECSVTTGTVRALVPSVRCSASPG